MPSAFSHAVAALAIARGAAGRSFTPKLAVWAMISAVVPDLDSIGFACGIPYEHLLGHRGFTHSVSFAVLWSLLLTFLAFRRSMPMTAFIVLFLATFSHPLLDMLTNGGLGCALWAPFDNERLFFPWRPVQVSPIAVDRFFSSEGWRVLKSELIWVWLPSGIVFLLAGFIRRRSTGRPSNFAA
jgi:inner membrane protein